MTTAPTRPEVRVRQDSDIDSCARALTEVHRTDGYPVEGVDEPEKWLRPAGLLRAWVAGPADGIVGHAAFCRPQGEAAVTMLAERTGLAEDQIGVIARLFVVPAGRGHGLGEALAREGLRYAAGQGRRVVFDVMAKDRDAIRLYERLGCQRLGTTTHVFGANGREAAYCYAAPPHDQ